jgi:hypothetical protein
MPSAMEGLLFIRGIWMHASNLVLFCLTAAAVVVVAAAAACLSLARSLARSRSETIAKE